MGGSPRSRSEFAITANKKRKTERQERIRWQNGPKTSVGGGQNEIPGRALLAPNRERVPTETKQKSNWRKTKERSAAPRTGRGLACKERFDGRREKRH